MKSKIVIVIFIALLISACNSGAKEEAGSSTPATNNTPLGLAGVEDGVSDKTIMQIAIDSEDHTTLVAAVQAAEIKHVLANVGPLTVFAPTNAAFDALPEGTVETLLKPENKEKLANILTNHAAPGTLNIESLKKEADRGRKIYTAIGDYLDIVVDGDVITVGGAKILGTVKASNGIVIVVDKIILPAEK